MLVSLARIGESDVDEGCDPPFRLLHGVVEGAGVTVSVLRGDGRRLAARTARLPGTRLTAYAHPVPAGVALRSIRIRRGDGSARTIGLARAPLSVTCGLRPPGTGLLGTLTLYSIEGGPPITPVGPAAAVAGDIAFRVADGPGGSLCTAFGEQPFTLTDCNVVAPGFEDVTTVVDDPRDPRALLLALPAAVAAVRIAGGDGPPREVPTVTGDGYAGAYAGRVRFAATTITGFRDLNHVTLLDAAGAVLRGASARPGRRAEDRATPLAVRRLAGGAGRPSLWQSGVRAGARTTTCLTLTDGPRPQDGGCDATREDGAAVLLRSSCATRRLTIAVTAPAGSRVVAATGAGRSRTIALRRGVGLVTLAPSGGVRSLTIVRPPGRDRTRTLVLRAPAGARQCGWSAAANP
jgi:hypothetical protein